MPNHSHTKRTLLTPKAQRPKIKAAADQILLKWSPQKVKDWNAKAREYRLAAGLETKPQPRQAVKPSAPVRDDGFGRFAGSVYSMFGLRS